MHHPCGQSRGHNLISGLFLGGVSSVIMCPRITPHNLPIPPAVYIYSRRASSSALRTETRLGKRQRLDWVRGHHMPRLRHPSLTCSTVDTSGIIGRSRYIRVLACATQTCISRQTRTTSSSGVSPTALCCKEACAYVTFLLRRSLWCRL
jgi:hypothetical protein